MQIQKSSEENNKPHSFFYFSGFQIFFFSLEFLTSYCFCAILFSKYLHLLAKLTFTFDFSQFQYFFMKNYFVCLDLYSVLLAVLLSNIDFWSNLAYFNKNQMLLTYFYFLIESFRVVEEDKNCEIFFLFCDFLSNSLCFFGIFDYVFSFLSFLLY